MSRKDGTTFDDAIEALNFAIEILETVLEKSDNALEPKFVEMYSLKEYLPFSIEYTSIKGTYMLTNRAYNPLGFSDKKWFDYDKYPSLHIKLSDEELLSVIKEGSNNLFWDYPNTPMNSVSEAYEYLTRLKRLLNTLESKK